MHNEPDSYETMIPAELEGLVDGKSFGITTRKTLTINLCKTDRRKAENLFAGATDRAFVPNVALMIVKGHL